ncbi:hypothetical protein K443DRAFT_62827, partial [Laccaria amethystina LaAM-08-1]
EAYPLLLLLAESAESESLPQDWIENVATHFTMLLELVNEHWLSVANADSAANTTIPTPVSTNRTRMCGRPRKNVDPNVLHDAFKANRRIPKTVLANVLGIDRNTLNTRLKELNIDSGFSDISDPELDAHKHKRYHVPRPNSLWHIDGHHKLIVWGIVIHGIADGYSRKANKLPSTS